MYSLAVSSFFHVKNKRSVHIHLVLVGDHFWLMILVVIVKTVKKDSTVKMVLRAYYYSFRRPQPPFMNYSFDWVMLPNRFSVSWCGFLRIVLCCFLKSDFCFSGSRRVDRPWVMLRFCYVSIYGVRTTTMALGSEISKTDISTKISNSILYYHYRTFSILSSRGLNRKSIHQSFLHGWRVAAGSSLIFMSFHRPWVAINRLFPQPIRKELKISFQRPLT